ncbi:MAG: Uma2 family endonuclease [Aphanocapsa sp. GSE-SYN-MK-11-07L]|jgi:Uma2 family endonuclease|nr:Uma2 family endonuclease [Aphanocapsa sp. GSE-SYN-MK-11-07L]
MPKEDNPSPQRSPQEDLYCHYASRQIEQTYSLYPEFRLELVEGKFLIGGILAGSRWLLREALLGWGAEAAIAFAPIEQWWEALRVAYQVSHQHPEDWLIWAESLPATREDWWPPLGSQYGGEHRWVRNRLRTALSAAVGRGYGRCFGSHYGMWIGNHVFTPDLLLLEDIQLAENQFYDRYVQGAAHLVIEIVLPEHAEVDEQVRQQYYEQYGVPHYWTVNPIAQQVKFWCNTPTGYQRQSLDADGGYRGVPGLTFTPDLLWVDDDHLPGLPLGLPIVASEFQRRRWQLRQEASETGQSWDSIPFEPLVGLEPVPIQPEQFVSWCPESKLEGGPFPLIGGQRGTRHAIAMLLMTLGLVETVKLLPGYEWVRVLRRIEREQQNDSQQRQAGWQQAEAIAQQLHQDYQVGGVGVIGDLQRSTPLHRWSTIHLVLWDCSDQDWQIKTENPFPVDITEVAWASPAEWQLINQNMTVLVGEWKAQEQPNLGQRSVFHWLDETESA